MKEKTTSRSDRVAIEPDMHVVYEQLSKGADPEDVPFGELKDVFMMAACLGYAKGKRKQLSGRRDIVRWETFSRDTDIPILYAMAIAEQNDVGVLDDGFEFLTIAEEYANAGIHILEAKISRQRGKPLWNLVDLIQSEITNR